MAIILFNPQGVNFSFPGNKVVEALHITLRVSSYENIYTVASEHYSLWLLILFHAALMISHHWLVWWLACHQIHVKAVKLLSQPTKKQGFFHEHVRHDAKEFTKSALTIWKLRPINFYYATRIVTWSCHQEIWYWLLSCNSMQEVAGIYLFYKIILYLFFLGSHNNDL